MKKLIISSHNQFGYLIDTYKYCEYIKGEYKLIYICFNENKEKINMDGIDVKYVKKSGNIILDFLKLNLNIVFNSYKYRVKKLFCVYNPLIFISRLLLPNRKIILDIRTGSVEKNKKSRKKANKRLKINTLFFKDITIISEGLAKILKIKHYRVLPLGADKPLEICKKNNGELSLIYVGSLSNRKIIDTVRGFNKFIKYNKDINAKYIIIGFFNRDDEEKKELLNEINNSKSIQYLGEKKHYEIEKFFKKSNIGISYIPITDYYNFQPPTKTYEYITNGLITIATATYENKKLIKKSNGILCEDNEESFALALQKISKNLNLYDPQLISESLKENTWENIVKKVLKPMLN